MNAADKTRSEAGARRKLIERMVLDLICNVGDGMASGIAMQRLWNEVTEVIPMHIVEQHRERRFRSRENDA